MSNNDQTVKTGWSSVQVYTLSAICLLIGVSIGYLFRGSTTQAPASATVQTQMPAVDGSTAKPTPDAMKRMAEKQVAPLLEQLKKNPNDADTMIKLGSFYFAAQQFEDSAKYFEMAANVKPSAEALTRLANAQYYGGSGDKAIDTLNRALKIDPKFANALFNLGELKWQLQGDTKGAIECWEKLLKTNPNHPRRADVEKMIAKAKEHAKVARGTKTDKPAM